MKKLKIQINTAKLMIVIIMLTILQIIIIWRKVEFIQPAEFNK